MRQRWFSLVSVCLLLLTAGCAVSPSPAAPPTPTDALMVTATPEPTPESLVAEKSSPLPTGTRAGSPEAALLPLRQALKDYDGLNPADRAIITALEDTVRAYLTAAEKPLTAQTADLLAGQLDGIFPTDPPVVQVADVNHQGEPDLLLGLPFMFGFPAFAFLAEQAYTPLPLPVDSLAVSNKLYQVDADFLPYAFPTQFRVEDVTGDGEVETLVVYMLPGGSGFTVRLYTFQWQPASRTFAQIFQADLVNWAAEASWQLQPGPDGSQEFVLKGAAFGPFDHKLLVHPTKTEIWRWQPAAGQFVQADETVTAPVTLRQQFNVAEALLRRGDYDQAVTEFERVLNDAALEVEDTGGSSESKTDWQALAHLRLGQTYALLGQVDQARAALKAAQTETGTVADLATAFLNAYQNDASLTAAWQAMMAAVPLEQLIYEGQAVGLGFPIDAVGVFYRGLPIAAYLDRHPEAVGGSPAELQAALTGPGLEIETVAFADVTGDGRQDILLTLEAQDWQRVWVAYQLADDDRWRTGILTEGEMVNLNNLVPNPTGGQLLRLDDFGYGWDAVSEQAVTYYLGEGIPQPIDNPWPIIGVF